MESIKPVPTTITSFTWDVHPGARFSSLMVYYVTELKRTDKAVYLRCNESKRAYWVPLSWFEGSVGSVHLRRYAAALMSRDGKNFVATEAIYL